MESSYYFERLYPLQDAVLASLRAVDTGFYLSGDTAASRVYLQHRFSDDLDLFVNDAPSFGLWAARLIQRLATDVRWKIEVGLREERFVRLTVFAQDASLKIELINDVPAHVGGITAVQIGARWDTHGTNVLDSGTDSALFRNRASIFGRDFTFNVSSPSRRGSR